MLPVELYLSSVFTPNIVGTLTPDYSLILKVEQVDFQILPVDMSRSAGLVVNSGDGDQTPFCGI